MQRERREKESGKNIFEREKEGKEGWLWSRRLIIS